MSRARLFLVAGNLALAALVVATESTRLGLPRWHHDAAYMALALAGIAAWPVLRRRRVASLLLASLVTWCTLTGLLLVYGETGGAYARWMGWWHGVTSAGLLVAFFAHWARNNTRLVQLWRKLTQRSGALGLLVGAWVLLALMAVATTRSPLADRYADRYLDLITAVAFAWAAMGVLVAGLLMIWRRDQPVAVATTARNRARGALDASLLGTMWLTALTGFPLLYLTRELRALDAYWVTTAWHVVLGALLVGLVAGHVLFNRRPLVAHTR